ncbi:unnamed protein product [Adineta steineri]|uniref:Uncharacterized protein n=1 Tax=Adineta steineri TaxID=433720 RepID=A0A815TGP4_9BILA|nr:unnamed protein product [Adineta steineri]CAF4121101.1 unnamed protein product [Adineta steineri]
MSTLTETTVLANIASTRRRIRQNYLLIWVDVDIDENNDDFRNALTELRKVVPEVKTCRTSEQCIEYLNEMVEDKAFVISSAALSQHLVPEMITFTKLDAIYILGGNRAQVEEWASEWPKIEGVYNAIQPICQSLNKVIRGCDHDLIPMSFVSREMIEAATLDESNNNRLPPAYMYTLLFKEIVLEIDDDSTEDMKKFVSYCRENGINEAELKEFQENYHRKTPVWWYTCEIFVYGMLNQALRQMQMETMVKMSFYIRHLHQQLRQLHQEQSETYKTEFIVYRGQSLSKEDFQRLLDTNDGLLSFNNFLSTSMDKNVSMDFVERTLLKNKEIVGVLFVITIDRNKVSPLATPFALIDDYTAIPGEQEILFSMHTVFRVGEIKNSAVNKRLWEVQLTLTDANDTQLTALTKRITEEIVGHGWLKMGQFLLKAGASQQAEELYKELAQDTSSILEQAHIYHMRGMTAMHQGDYSQSIKFFEQSLAINKIIMPKGHSSIPAIYHNVASAYDSLGNYTKALECYQNALGISKKILAENHPDLAISYNNIGLTYANMKDYTKALEYYEKALEIRKKSLPESHPDLAISYTSIGIMYKNIGDYTKALEYCKKDVEISKKTLPDNHPSLATSYVNIGTVYNDMKNYTRALEYYDKALTIQKKILRGNHPDLANSYHNIALGYNNLGDYTKALEYYNKTLKIREGALPENHPDLVSTYVNVAVVYNTMADYQKALEYFQKVLRIKKKALPGNHQDLISSYNNIASVYDSMSDYTKAQEYYEKALHIGREALSENCPELATTYGGLGCVYYNLGNYTKALKYHEGALQVRKETLPENDPALANSFDNLAGLYNAKKDYTKALEYYEKALQIKKATLSENHLSLTLSYDGLGCVHYNTNNYTKALEYYEKMLRIRKDILPENHPDVAESYDVISVAYTGMRNYAKALEYLEKAFAIRRKCLSHLDPLLGKTIKDIIQLKKIL